MRTRRHRARVNAGKRQVAPTAEPLEPVAPARPPRLAEPLSVAGQMVVAWLKTHAARLDQLQDEVAEQVLRACEYGVSWEVIGWSLGMAGEDARHRWALVTAGGLAWDRAAT
jgi:hypothetical protein